MATDPSPPSEPELVHVLVPDVPVHALLATEGFQRSVLREFDLMFVAASKEGTQPGAQILVARNMLQMYEEGYRAVLDAAEAAAAAQQRTVDIHIDLPAQAAEAARIYLRTMEDVDEDARQLRLLTPPDPEVTRFRRWFVQAVINQLEAGQLTGEDTESGG